MSRVDRVGHALGLAFAWVVQWVRDHPWPAACIGCVFLGMAIGLWL